MNFSRDSVLALQRHFLGALSTPSCTWLEPLPAKRLAFDGTIVRSTDGGCLLDLGTVTSPGEERHTVRVSNPGTKPVEVRIGHVAPWMTVRWLETPKDTVTLDGGDAGAILELTVAHDGEIKLAGTLRLVTLEDAQGTRVQRVEEVALRMTARRLHPIALFNFNGSPVPRPFDFGAGANPYELSVVNEAAVPLVVSFADLPPWLTFKVDGHSRKGPIPGYFFERTAPVTVRLVPNTLGRHHGSLRLQTNDGRPELQAIELQFAACIEAATPCVRAIAPQRARLRADQTLVLAARLENSGRIAAQVVSQSELPDSLEVPPSHVVPPARDGEAGTTMLPIRIVAAQLAPGAHVIGVTLRIAGGDPSAIAIPVHVEVTPARSGPRASRRHGAIVGLFVLLVLAVLFAFVMRGLS
jgi:hypothetical protein